MNKNGNTIFKKVIGDHSGQLSLQVLAIGTVALFLISGLILWLQTYVGSVSREADKGQAFTIAEAGIEYYRWHLAHAPTDFTDGTSSSTGPYIHPYYDRNNNRIGEFQLTITPPASGTTILGIQSVGLVDSDASIRKVIEVKMGLPSLARYSVVSNSDIRFGEGTEVYGELHSNGGIHFDGVAHNRVTSAKSDYNDPDHSGGNEFGVHTHVSPTDPLPSSTVPLRPDVFRAGREFPVPAIDFNGLTQDLATIKADAQSTNGYYRGPSTAKGYELVLKTDDTFDLYRVNTVVKESAACRNNSTQSDSWWGTWTVGSRTQIGSSLSFPSNGIFFFEDDLWVSGQIDTAHLTIGAARFPVNVSTYASITVNSNLTYTNFDGSDILSLISQNHVNVGLQSDDNLTIDGALVAQNGRIGRYHYAQQCGTGYIRASITAYGMLATNGRYGWAWSDGTGYQARTITYDGNLLYNPPPDFPITTNQYNTLYWGEVQ